MMGWPCVTYIITDPAALLDSIQDEKEKRKKNRNHLLDGMEESKPFPDGWSDVLIGRKNQHKNLLPPIQPSNDTRSMFDPLRLADDCSFGHGYSINGCAPSIDCFEMQVALICGSHHHHCADISPLDGEKCHAKEPRLLSCQSTRRTIRVAGAARVIFPPPVSADFAPFSIAFVQISSQCAEATNNGLPFAIVVSIADVDCLSVLNPHQLFSNETKG